MTIDLMAELDAMVAEEAASRKSSSTSKRAKAPSTASTSTPTSKPVESKPEPYTPIPQHAKRRIFLVREQHCTCCSATHPVIAGEFIEFAFPGGLNTHRMIVAPNSDRTFDSLPREVEWLPSEHITCPDCLAASIIHDELAGRVPLQFPLFPWSAQ